MKIVESPTEPNSYDLGFEQDPVNDLSELVIVVNALGLHSLERKFGANHRSAAYLANRLRQSDLIEKDDDPNTVVSPQEAEILVTALHNYAETTSVDVEYYGYLRNYLAINTRIVEGEMAVTLAEQIEAQFEMQPYDPSSHQPFGFGAALSS